MPLYLQYHQGDYFVSAFLLRILTQASMACCAVKRAKGICTLKSPPCVNLQHGPEYLYLCCCCAVCPTTIHISSFRGKAPLCLHSATWSSSMSFCI